MGNSNESQQQVSVRAEEQESAPADSISAAPGHAVTAVIVTYDNDPAELRAAIDSLCAQTQPPSRILLLDNGPEGALARELDGYTPLLQTIARESNVGYGAGINIAAESSSSEYLLCMNPDAHAEVGCLQALLSVANADPGIALVGAQILMADGASCNGGANPLHPTGISPAGGYGGPRERGPAREVAVVSGACFLVRRSSLLSLGGFLELLFLYYDDVDLAWRARIAGWRVIYCPEAAVRHDYDFGRRPRKWFLLERNRLFSLLANYQARTLVLLSPLLAMTEVGLLAVATRGGWLGQKLLSYVSLWHLRKDLGYQRRRVQASRRCTDAELLSLFEDRLQSPLLPTRTTRIANAICLPYLRLMRFVLSHISSSTAHGN